MLRSSDWLFRVRSKASHFLIMVQTRSAVRAEAEARKKHVDVEAKFSVFKRKRDAVVHQCAVPAGGAMVVSRPVAHACFRDAWQSIMEDVAHGALAAVARVQGYSTIGCVARCHPDRDHVCTLGYKPQLCYYQDELKLTALAWLGARRCTVVRAYALMTSTTFAYQSYVVMPPEVCALFASRTSMYMVTAADAEVLRLVAIAQRVVRIRLQHAVLESARLHQKLTDMLFYLAKLVYRLTFPGFHEREREAVRAKVQRMAADLPAYQVQHEAPLQLAMERVARKWRRRRLPRGARWRSGGTS